MPEPGSLRFSSLEEYRARRGDAAWWQPHLAELLGRHGLPGAGRALPGRDATYPTFICGEQVVKVFGVTPAWRQASASERAALEALTLDPGIAAPRLLAGGELFPGAEAAWPYLVMSRVPGVPARRASLSPDRRRELAVAVGRQLRRVHALRPADAPRPTDWPAQDVTAAAARSSLPPHLVAQAATFLGEVEPGPPVFVHGDLNGAHAFVEDGRLSGIIDWGDALWVDRHYEVIQLYRDLFACRSDLLQRCLDAAEWPRDEAFARRALAQALRRQALGLVQHLGMDVFEPIAARFDLAAIATLDELAARLFGG